MTDKSLDLPPWESPDAAVARPGWRDVSSQIVFDNPWIEVSSRDVIAPTGNPAHYGLVRFKNQAIGVLPLHDDGTVPLVGQMRYPSGRFSWEIPEGGAPYGESPVAGAQRELLEETGLVADELYQILEMELSNSVTDEVAICFLATGLRQREAAPDDTEKFEYARVPFPQVLEAVIKGQIRDSLTVACVLRVHHMAVKGELAPHLCKAVLNGG